MSSPVDKDATGGQPAVETTTASGEAPPAKDAGLNRTVAMQAVVAPAPASKRGLIHTVALAAALPRSTLKMKRPNPALLRTQVMAAVTARAPVPAPAAVPAPPPAAPAAVPPPARPCSPTDDARLCMLVEPNGDRATHFRLLRDNLATKGIPRV